MECLSVALAERHETQLAVLDNDSLAYTTRWISFGAGHALAEGAIVTAFVQELKYRGDRRRQSSQGESVEQQPAELPFVTLGFVGGLRVQLTRQQVAALVQESRNLKVGALLRVRVVSISPSRRSFRVSLDLSAPLPDRSGLGGSMRGAGTGRSLLKPGDLIVQENLRVLVATEQGLFVSIRAGSSTEKRGLQQKEGNERGELMQKKRKRSTRQSPGTAEGDQAEVLLGFLPKLHLSDEVRLAEELFDLLQMGQALPFQAVVLSSASAVRPGATLRVLSAKAEAHADGGARRPTTGEDARTRQLASLLSERLQQPVDEQSDSVVVRDICILSCKPSLTGSAADGSFLEGPRALEALAARSVRPRVMLGYVRRVGPFGLLLSFGAWQLTGLVPHSYISDAFVVGTEDGHLQRMYREGMTVRGTVVSVHSRQPSGGNADGRQSREGEAGGPGSAKGPDHGGDKKAAGVERPLQFVVDIRPERLSYLQRQQQAESGEKTKEGIGVRMMRALLDQKLLATRMKQERVSERAPLEKLSAENTSPRTQKELPTFRVGELVRGRLTQVLQSCLLVHLYGGGASGLKGGGDDRVEGGGPAAKQTVTGVVLQHQLADGDTLESLEKQQAASVEQEGKGLERYFVVLDVDPVTGIVDLSCRGRLLEPLLSLRTTLANGAKRFRYAHFVVEDAGGEGARSSKERGRASKNSQPGSDPPDAVCAGSADDANAAEEKADRQSTVVITRMLRCHQRAAKSTARQSMSKPAGSCPPRSPKSRDEELKPDDQWDLEHRVVPDEVLELMQKQSVGAPPRSAEVQVENTAYSVLVADCTLSVYFSDNESGSVCLDKGRPAHTTKFPLFLVTLSCRNNTLQPVQPSAEAFRATGVEGMSGASVLLSPQVRRHSSSSLLLADCCWEPRQQQLVELQQRKAAQVPRGGQLLKVLRGGDTTGSHKGRLRPDTKSAEASTVQNVEREVVRGAILRCRLTFVGPSLALGRIQKPRQQLLLRLHAADALPAPAEYSRLRLQQRKVDAQDTRPDCPEQVSCASVPNPLKQLSPGNVLEVRVLRIRRRGGVSEESTASAAADNASEEPAPKRKKATEERDSAPGAVETDATAARKDEWVADVALACVDTSGEGNSIPVGASDIVLKKEPHESTGSDVLNGCLWAVVEKVGPRFLKVQCGRGCQVLAPCDSDLSAEGEAGAKKHNRDCCDSLRDGSCLLGGSNQLLRGRVDWFDSSNDPQKALSDCFETGDMLCVKPLPVLRCPAESVEALRAKASSQKEDGSRADGEPKAAPPAKKRVTVLQRFMVVPMNTRPGSAVHGNGNSVASTPDLAQTLQVHRSLTETTFTSSEAAVTAWCEWRHPVNSVVWGLVHHFLPPPFAVAVQLSTAVLSAASDAKDTATKRKLYGLETRKGSASRSVAEVPVLAAVHMTELMDEWSSDPVKRLNLKVGQLVKLRVLPVLAAEQVQQELRQQKTKSRSGLPLEASMRLSEVEGTLEGCQEKRKATECKGQHALQFSDLEVGQTLSGIVVSSGRAGVFFAINRGLTVRVKLSRLLPHSTPATSATKTQGGAEVQASSGLVTAEEAKTLFPVGRVAENIRIVDLEPETKRIEGSLRQDLLRKRRSPGATEDQGERLDGAGGSAKKQRTDADSVASADGNVSDAGDAKSPTNNPLLNSLKVGDVLDGRVRAVETFGVFVRLQEDDEGERSRKFVDALCHLSEMGGADWKERRARLQRLQKGDLVRARVIRKDPQQGRVWVSLDPGVFEEDEGGDVEDEAESRFVSTSVGDDSSSKARFTNWDKDSLRGCSRPSVSAPEGLSEDADGVAEGPGLSTEADEDEGADEEGDLFGGADITQSWSSCFSADTEGACDRAMSDSSRVQEANILIGSESSGDENEPELSRHLEVESDEEQAENKDASGRRRREQEAREEDANVRLIEENAGLRSWMEDPKSPADFERLLLVNGNSAAVWISYMAFYLKQNELNTAREIAERAVRHINYREEQERCSVWIAYLNLECVYGNRVEDVFKRAVQYNDAKKIYYQMTFIYEKANQYEQARQMCEKCCDKYPESQKMWVRRLTLLYSRLNAVSSARDLILQALFRLPRRKHIAFVATCARLEYKHGSKERGQTYFEKLLAEHPKRTDIWSQYLDAHIAAHTPPRCVSPNLQSVRVLFERMTSLNLKLRKMKFFFTRWLLFEKQHGTPETQALVRERAREYVRSVEARIQQETQ